MKAVIRDFRADPKNPRTVATITLAPEDSVCMVTADSARFRHDLAYDGIIGQGGKRFKPEDGQIFIQQMPFHFKSAYLRAEVVPD